MAVPPRHGHRLRCDVAGDGSPCVLLHGVAFGPETFGEVVRRLSGSSRVIVPHRSGYGRSADLPPASLHEQVGDLARLLADVCTEPAVVAGVSGGATLAVALALAHPRLVARLVVHEPALGPLGPGVAAMLAEASRAFAVSPDPSTPAIALARTLAGERVWSSLPSPMRLARVAPAMAREVPQFASFAPTVDELAELRALPVLSCVGRDSGPERYEVSRVLAGTAGAVERILPCAHLAQIEAPEAFATAITPDAAA